MAQIPSEATADGLRQLLVVEQRLQGLIRKTREEAARRVDAARAARKPRLAAARDEAQQAAAKEAAAEGEAHQAALAAIDSAQRRAVAAIASVPDARIDELAREALVRAIGMTGVPS